MLTWLKTNDTVDLAEMRAQLRQESHSILSFWTKYMLDNDNGGIYGLMDAEHVIHRESEKSLVLHMRCLWAFSHAARTSGNRQYGEIASQLFEYVGKHFHDAEYGGWIWTVDYRGKSIDTRKHVYGQFLAIYALTEYFRWTKDEVALQLAMTTHRQIESLCRDATGKGYINTFETDWSPCSDFRMVKGEDNAPIHVGVLIHSIEALTELYHESGDELVRSRLFELSMLFHNELINPGTGHLLIYLDEDWQSVSDEVRVGHEVEYAWLALEAAEALGNAELTESCKKVSVSLTDLARTTADKNSALFFDKKIGRKTVRIWRWWDQAEMMLALWYAYKYTGKDTYLQELGRLWRFVATKIHDKQYGDWHFNVRSRRRGYKGYAAGPWKTPYHAYRATSFIAWQID